ncbi:MAG: site-specific integrase [Pseudomonadota bacterium]
MLHALKLLPSKKERYVRIRNCPGISRLEKWDARKQRWIDPRTDSSSRAKVFRAYRRIQQLGKSLLQKRHFRTIDDARRWRMELNPEPGKGRAAQITLREVIGEWREWSKPPRLRKTSWLQYAKDIGHLEPLWNAPIEALTARDIDLWLAHLKDPSYPKQRTRVSFAREVGTLQTICKWYRQYRNEKFQHPILPRHKQDSHFREDPPSGQEVLTEKQAEEFLLLMVGRHADAYGRTAALQLFAGLRIGEACGLKWDRVDLENRTLMIRRSCTWPQPAMRPEMQEQIKTAASARDIPIVDRLFELLVKWKAEDGEIELVCHRNGRLIRRNSVASAYAKVFRMMGLRMKSVTHSLRRTFATLHAEQTHDLVSTQTLLGHTDIQTTQIYAKVTDAAVRRSMPNFSFGTKKE